MATPKLKEPEFKQDKYGERLGNDDLPSKVSQFDSVSFAERWDSALQKSITTRNKRHKVDTKELQDNPALKDDKAWMAEYKSHEERIDREMAAQEVVNEYLTSMQE